MRVFAVRVFPEETANSQCDRSSSPNPKHGSNQGFGILKTRFPTFKSQRMHPSRLDHFAKTSSLSESVNWQTSIPVAVCGSAYFF